MKFKVRKKTFLKSKDNTTNIMYSTVIILVLFILFATYKNGIYPTIKGYGSLYLLFKPLIFASIGAVVCLFTEYLYYVIKGDKKSFYYLFTSSFAIIPGVFLSLIIPINTPIWLLILGSFIASLSKVIMGGFGKNKFNPALVGALFVTVIFSSYNGGYLNNYEVDTISSATPLANMTASGYVISYDNLVKPYGSLLDFFVGSIPGSIGETSSLLIILAFIYLAYKRYIKARIPISYVLTVSVISLMLCIIKDIGLWFVLFNILSGGLLFGAVLMATDPVTTPISNRGQIIGGIILGIVTMVIRYMTPLPEGVLISILILNVCSIFINYFTIILYNKNIVRNIIMVVFILSIIPISFVISSKITNKPLDDSFEVLSKVKSGNDTIYEVRGRGYAGNGSLKLKIVFTGNEITRIDVIKSNETYTKMIYDNDYLNKLTSYQNNLDNLDTISGATYTSNYLKDIIRKTIEDYEG